MHRYMLHLMFYINKKEHPQHKRIHCKMNLCVILRIQKNYNPHHKTNQGEDLLNH